MEFGGQAGETRHRRGQQVGSQFLPPGKHTSPDQSPASRARLGLPPAGWHRASYLADPFLLPRGEALLVAVSGGPGIRWTLIRLLLDLTPFCTTGSYGLWHGNHGWRPEAAGPKRKACLTGWVVGLAGPAGSGATATSSEAAARDWRYGPAVNIGASELGLWPSWSTASHRQRPGPKPC